MAGYTRADVTNSINNGNTIDAIPLDAEFEAIQTAFASVGGHNHSGGVGEGAPITTVGPSQDIVVSANSISPRVTNTVDLGSSVFEYRNLWVDGVANIDSLISDTADINGGTIDNAAIGVTVPSTIRGTTITATGSFVGPVTGAVTGNASTATALQTPRNINGVAFNGTANIVTTSWGTARLVTIGNTARSVDGTTPVSWTLSDIGVGTLGTQAANSVAITGGVITGITDLAIADGGTGASTADAARTNLGATATGTALFTAASPAAARTTLGATATGNAVFTAVDAATGRAALDAQPLDSTLTALAGLDAGVGLLVQTGADTFAKRAVVGTANQIVVAAGAGAAGDPTISAVIATQAEAEVGTDNVKLMSALRTRQSIPVALNATGAAPMFACRAWVNFNGTGTLAVRASGNVSSITDNGVGDYTINFITPMPDANYAVMAIQSAVSSTGWIVDNSAAGTRTAGAIRLLTVSSGGSPQDPTHISVAIFR